MKFTVYSKHGCPYCNKIMTILTHLNTIKGIPVIEYVLDTQFTREEFYKQFGDGSTFPQVVLSDSINLGGCVDTIKYLKEQNLI